MSKDFLKRINNILILTGINLVTLVIGFYAWQSIATPTYKIVALFITLIIVSNVIAKLVDAYLNL